MYGFPVSVENKQSGQNEGVFHHIQTFSVLNISFHQIKVDLINVQLLLILFKHNIYRYVLIQHCRLSHCYLNIPALQI